MSTGAAEEQPPRAAIQQPRSMSVVEASDLSSVPRPSLHSMATSESHTDSLDIVSDDEREESTRRVVSETMSAYEEEEESEKFNVGTVRSLLEEEEEDFEQIDGASIDEGFSEGDGLEAFPSVYIPVFALLFRADVVKDCQDAGIGLPRSLLFPINEPEGGIAESKARLMEIAKSVQSRRKSNLVGLAGGLNPLRALVSKKKRRFTEMGFNLDLTYLTERLIAMGFPAEKKTEKFFRNTIGETNRFLESFHRDRYALYNLCSERQYNAERFHNRVYRFPFDDHEAPTLKLMMEFCTSVDAWLQENPQNIAAVHCKAGKGRTGVMLSAYLVFSGEFNTAANSLKFYDFVRTENSKGVTIPSQRRFVHYFDKLANRNFSFEGLDQYLCLQTVRLVGVPRMTKTGSAPYFQIRLLSGDVIDSRAFLKVQHYDKDAVNIDFHCPELHLREEVRFEFFHEDCSLLHFWIHVGLVENNFLELTKPEIDGANKDKTHKMFPEKFAIQMFWCPTRLTQGIHPDLRAWTMAAERE